MGLAASDVLPLDHTHVNDAQMAWVHRNRTWAFKWKRSSAHLRNPAGLPAPTVVGASIFQARPTVGRRQPRVDAAQPSPAFPSVGLV